MKNYRFIAAVTCGILMAGSLASCNNGSSNEKKKEKEKPVPPEVVVFIERGTEILTEENSYWERWEYDFNSYMIGNGDVKVNCQYIDTYDKNGKEHCYKCYYDAWDDKPLVSIESNYVWSLEYDPDLGTIFLEEDFPEEYNDIVITNLNMNPSDFNRFDSEYRLWIYGNAYTNNEELEEDESELSGIEVIDITQKVMVLQALSSGELMRYEKKYGKPTLPTAGSSGEEANEN